MATLGVFLGLLLLIVLAFRNTNVVVATLLAALVVAITNQQSLVTALTVSYTGKMMGFAGAYMLVFLTGAIFGRVMGDSQAATAIALELSHRMGVHRVLYIIAIACALLTYGGVNVFVVVFTIFPLGLSLMNSANLPKRLLMGPITIGAGTFTMTAMPGSPSIHNVIGAKALGTSLTASPLLGIIASVIMFTLGMWYMESQRKKAGQAGETFEANSSEEFRSNLTAEQLMPSWKMAMIPLVAVLITIMLPMWTISLAYGDKELPAILQFSKSQPVLWTSLAMIVGTLSCLVLFWKQLALPLNSISRGAESSFMPLINTAAVIGFGAVVQSTEAFGQFAKFMIDSNLPPLLSASIAINLFSGIVGSASGGLGIFYETVAQHYLDQGVAPDTLHRVVCIGSGGLDSLPHSGAIISFLTVAGLTHKEAYKDIFVVSVLVPLFTLAVILAGLMAF
jgi:H+/gluconate symporter-like permease